jgi:uncharacterized protein YjbJ (UPF0337 family)
MDKDRVKGKVKDIQGRIKRQAGEWTGDRKTQAEGAKDQVEGKLRDVLGKIKDDISDAKKNVKERERSRKKDAA